MVHHSLKRRQNEPKEELKVLGVRNVLNNRLILAKNGQMVGKQPFLNDGDFVGHSGVLVLIEVQIAVSLRIGVALAVVVVGIAASVASDVETVLALVFYLVEVVLCLLLVRGSDFVADGLLASEGALAVELVFD